MARDNPSWGTERIRGELLERGIVVSASSIHRCRAHGRPRPPGRSWRTFLADQTAVRRCGSLRRVVCSGEELPASLAARFLRLLPRAELHNLYGPTEAAIDVAAQSVGARQAAAGKVPIGRPITGARLYVLDRRTCVVPARVPGELHIGGPLARGYLNSPGKTAGSGLHQEVRHEY